MGACEQTKGRTVKVYLMGRSFGGAPVRIPHLLTMSRMTAWFGSMSLLYVIPSGKSIDDVVSLPKLTFVLLPPPTGVSACPVTG